MQNQSYSKQLKNHNALTTAAMDASFQPLVISSGINVRNPVLHRNLRAIVVEPSSHAKQHAMDILPMTSANPGLNVELFRMLGFSHLRLFAFFPFWMSDSSRAWNLAL